MSTVVFTARHRQAASPPALDYATISGAEARENLPLPKEGYTHVSVQLPVSEVPADAPEPVRYSDFTTRWGRHRVTYTMHSFGKWLTENFVPLKVEQTRHYGTSPYGVPDAETSGIAVNRHNMRRPARTTFGELAR